MKKDIMTDASVINMIKRYHLPDVNAFWNLNEMDNPITKINWQGNVKPGVGNH